MKVSSIPVTSVTIILHNRVIWKPIFNLNMMVSCMHVINVTLKRDKTRLWQDIFKLNMKVSGTLVTCVTINLDTRVILKLTWRGKHAVSSREQAWQKVHLLKEPYYKNDTQKKPKPSFHSTLIFVVFLAQSVGCPYGWANQATQTILKIVS